MPSLQQGSLSRVRIHPILPTFPGTGSGGGGGDWRISRGGGKRGDASTITAAFTRKLHVAFAAKAAITVVVAAAAAAVVIMVVYVASGHTSGRPLG